jgi:hypothetical protein
MVLLGLYRAVEIMKTQIVQLESHDDFISVRDRMGWGQTTRVLLVWPSKGDILNRRLDLTLIKRHSIALGSQLALVTRNRDVRYQADRLDIPVFKSVREAEQSRWRHSRKRRKRAKAVTLPIQKVRQGEKRDLEAMREQAHPTTPRWLTHPVVRIAIFTIGVLSMLVVAAIFIPSAEVYITPSSKAETVTIDVSASPEQKTVDLTGAIPAHFGTIVVEGRSRTPATGNAEIPRQAATGRVTFFNLTEEEVTVPVGTIVSVPDDPPIRFTTTQKGTIPIGQEGATIPIQAVQPGSDGNVSSEKIVAIEGPLGLKLSVINKRGTDGGSDFTTSTPHQDDFQRLFDELIISLQDTAQTEFTLKIEPGDIPLSSYPINQEVLEESYYPEAGEPADYLDLNLRTEFQFPYASEADLHHLGRIVLDRLITDDFTPQPETLKVTQLTQPFGIESGKAIWKMQASWQMGANLNYTDSIALILGLAPDQALEILKENSNIESDPEIILTPDWWPRLPMLPFRIKIINSLETISSK